MLRRDTAADSCQGEFFFIKSHVYENCYERKFLSTRKLLN